MSPQSFEYIAAGDVAEALEVLDEYGDGAKVLAGGQSLVPLMNMRLARPDVVVDINRLSDLANLTIEADELRVGALVRHRELERPLIADPLAALLASAAGHVGHLPIRVRGTFAGSLAHADPAAEWCLIAVTVGARMVLTANTGQRIIDADDFFDYPYVTALRPHELLTEVRMPLLGPGVGAAFYEQAATAGGFAQAAACAVIAARAGRIASARVGIGAVSGRPTTVPAAEQLLVDAAPSDAVLEEVRQRVRDTAHPADDPRVPAGYRAALAAELVAAAVREAATRAGARWN